MTNKELQELLKQYLDDLDVAVFRSVLDKPILCGTPKVNEFLGMLIIE